MEDSDGGSENGENYDTNPNEDSEEQDDDEDESESEDTPQNEQEENSEIGNSNALHPLPLKTLVRASEPAEDLSSTLRKARDEDRKKGKAVSRQNVRHSSIWFVDC
jgi:protein AATF/BFR2